MTETLTEKQRIAMEALEGARRAGVPLSDYAKAKGLELRPVYDAIAALRRRGALPGTDRPRKRKSKFVAVRVTSSPVAVAEGGRAVAHWPGVPAGVRARVGDRVWRVASAELGVGGAGGARGCCALTGASSGCIYTGRRLI
jgi:hypothetical protein